MIQLNIMASIKATETSKRWKKTLIPSYKHGRLFALVPQQECNIYMFSRVFFLILSLLFSIVFKDVISKFYQNFYRNFLITILVKLLWNL